MKKLRRIEKDNRGVAIYARKSRITNKGDSIGVQFKQCAEYAKRELNLEDDYQRTKRILFRPTGFPENAS